MTARPTRALYFDGFGHGLFQFLANLEENNSREWFDLHRGEYDRDLLETAKGLVVALGPFIKVLNREFEVEPRIGRTISRISNDARVHRNKPPYTSTMYVSFPRQGAKWNTEALLYIGVHRHGISVGFCPGSCREMFTGPIQQGIKENQQLFRAYLKERRIPDQYFELAGETPGGLTKWPLPKSAKRWVALESFNVGEYFPSTDPIVHRRQMLGRIQEILLDLYPLWLFAESSDLKTDLSLYQENATRLSRPRAVAAD